MRKSGYRSNRAAPLRTAAAASGRLLGGRGRIPPVDNMAIRSDMYDGLPELGRNDECWCGSGQKYKRCHCGFDERLQALANAGEEVPHPCTRAMHPAHELPDQSAAFRPCAGFEAQTGAT